MGYTHYWTQTRDLSADEWEAISADVGAILRHVECERGITLANGMGEGGTRPEFYPTQIRFNGLGADSYETFTIHRNRPPKEPYLEFGGDFCKTERKPYDAAVTAVLCYLATITRRTSEDGEPICGSEAFFVESDGSGADFMQGLEIARAALPRHANQLDIPMTVMENDRWCAPHLTMRTNAYQVRFCVDGFGYVINKRGESYRFNSHTDLAGWLNANKSATFKRGGGSGWGSYDRIEKDIWNASGYFDQDRMKRLARAQERKLATLFPVPAEHAFEPPAFVRPGSFAENAGRPFAYWYTDLLSQPLAA